MLPTDQHFFTVPNPAVFEQKPVLRCYLSTDWSYCTQFSSSQLVVDVAAFSCPPP